MTFSTRNDGNIICTDPSDGQVYDVIKELAGSVEFHVHKPVKLVANVMDSTKGKAKVMVLLVSVQPVEVLSRASRNAYETDPFTHRHCAALATDCSARNRASS